MGYNKVLLPASGLQLCGSQFVTVGDTAIDIQELFDEDLAPNDQIMFYDNGTYMVYIYDSSTYDDTWETDLGPGFVDPVEGTRAVRDVDPGTSFWFRNADAEGKLVTFSGEVPSTETKTVSCGGELQLVSFPSPKNVGINDISFSGIQPNDQIMFYDNGTYMIYMYDSSTYDETWETDLGPGFVDPVEGTRATRTVNLSEGFWLNAQAPSITISLKNN